MSIEDKLRTAAANYAADVGLDERDTFHVLPIDGDFKSRRAARMLTAYLNSPEVKAKLEAEILARTVNTALYGPDPAKWPT